MEHNSQEQEGSHITNEPINERHLSQLASVGQIAAGIAHEVKNPLTAVKGFLQLLGKEKPDTYIDIAQSELENALATLENLLQVSKPDLENEPLSSFNILAELESILNLFMDQQYRVKVEKTFTDADVVVHGKRNLFKKALFNLLKNAHEAIQGEGNIYIDEYIRNEFLYLSIKDTGVGIPKEKFSLIGTPFFTTKEEGTGMGLTQVFSVVYQHGGSIDVDSVEGEGTRFLLKIPVKKTYQQGGVKEMNLTYNGSENIKEFFLANRAEFENQLLSEAVNVHDKIDEIRRIGNIDLLANAQKLVLYVVEGREHELMMFAKQEGIAWAKHALTIAFKLEWIQSIRRVLWVFLYNYNLLDDPENKNDQSEFFELEKRINGLLDQFLSNFFISYTQYKDELLKSQQELIQNLTLPIIPLTKSMSILPLIGTVDTFRLETIKQKIFEQISQLKINTLIIDLSGVALMETSVLNSFLKILDGISMMGCRSIITGTRPDMANNMVKIGVSFTDRAEIKGSLQQALEHYFNRENN
jgi:anti-anti-sigma regulatory factor/two-component sensor histidine kinase